MRHYRWTMQNTEGFTEEELERINQAAAILFNDEFGDGDPKSPTEDQARLDYAKSINDAMNNEWQPGMTIDELVMAVRVLLSRPDTAESFVAARRALGLTRERLAAALDMSERMIAYYESGERPIPRVVSLAMAQLLASHRSSPSGKT